MSLQHDDGGPPPSMRRTSIPAPPPEPGFVEFWRGRTERFAIHVGEVVQLSGRTFRAFFKRPTELSATLYQLESLGVTTRTVCATPGGCTTSHTSETASASGRW